MELLLAMKGRFLCHFFEGYLYKKKKDHPLLFRLVCSPPVCINLCSSGIGVSGEGAEQGGQKWNRVSHPVGSDTGAHFRPKTS